MAIWKVEYESAEADLAETTFQWRLNGVSLEGKTSALFDDDITETRVGGNLTCEVTLRDLVGRRKSKVSNVIVLQPSIVIDPPGKMNPPTLTAINEYEIQVELAADPSGVISGHNLEWSIDNTNWLSIPDITSPYILDTQLPNTLIYVRTSSYNERGEVFSDPATVITPPIPNPNTPPLALADNKWSITDVGTTGDAVLVINDKPVDGGFTINALYWRKDGGTPIALTLPTTYPATFNLINQFTDGVQSLVDLRFDNPVGPGAWSNTKPITTSTQSAGSVPNQSAEFGALTLAGAGGFQPVNNVGARVPLASNTPTRISGFGTGAQITAGALTFNTNGAAINGDVWRCTLSTGGTVDITINWLANTYSVISQTELSAALSNNGTNTGRTIKIREGDFVFPGGYIFDNRKYAAPGLTVMGSSPNHLSKQWGTRINGTMGVRNCSNITFRDFEIYTAGGSGTGASGIIKTYGDCELINFIRLGFRAYVWDYNDTTSGKTPGTSFGGNPCAINTASGGTSWTGTIEECYARDVYDFANLGVGGPSNSPVKIICNEWHNQGRDGVKISNISKFPNTPFEFKWNVAYKGYESRGMDANGNQNTVHNDQGFQFQGVSGVVYTNNIQVIMNVIFGDDTTNETGHQCLFSSGDGGTIPNQISHTNPYLVGNVCVAGGNHPLTLACNGGTIAFNTFVQPSTTYDTTNQPVAMDITSTKNTAAGTVLATPQIFCNIQEGDRDIPAAKNNVILGKAGSLVSYLSTFGRANNDRPARSYDELKTWWTSTNNTRGGFGSTIGTYGTPRDKSTWSFNSAVVEAARSTYYP